MKKLFRILALACFVSAMALVTSCQKDYDQLIGSWVTVRVVCDPPNQLAPALYTGSEFVFISDNTMKLIFTTGDTLQGSYSLADKKLSFTVNGISAQCDIIRLNNKEFEFNMLDTDYSPESGTSDLLITFLCQRK